MQAFIKAAYKKVAAYIDSGDWFGWALPAFLISPFFIL